MAVVPRPALWPLILVVTVWLGLAATTLAGLPDDEVAAGLQFMRSMLVATLVTMVVSCVAAFRGVGRNRRPWLWFAAAWTISVTPQIAYLAISIFAAPPEWLVMPILVCRLLWAPLTLIGVLSFPMQPLTGRERLKFAADITTVIGGGFMIMWYFLIGPTLAAADVGASAVVGIAFPLTDLGLMFGVCALLLRSGLTTWRHPLSIMAAGLAIYLVADLYYCYSAIRPEADRWSVGQLLLAITGTCLAAAAAAVHIADPEGGRSPINERLQRSVSQLPYLALAVGYALLLSATAREGELFPWGGLVLGVIITTGAVAMRQVIAMRENHELVVSDSLTGLANRVRLRAALDTAVRRHQTHGEVSAMLLIDLDGFKQVNDTRGHEVGDQLLVAFADILRRTVRQSDTAGRLGGDEFAVVLHRVGDPRQAAVVAQRILDAAAGEVMLDGLPTRIGASIGIAMTTPDDPAATVRHRADMAMYHAKRKHGHSYELYVDGFEDAAAAEASMVEELAAATEAGQLRVLYQPIVTLATARLTAVEALVRWQHPLRGTIPPDEFIPLAEQTGAIEQIGMYVLEEACRQVKAWQRLAGQEHLHASVNLSPRQLSQPDLVARVAAVLERTGLDPHDLVLELTESALVSDDSGVEALEALRGLGIRIALDDFGTGYSSLRYLTRLPVDILKLDRCFVAELNGEAEGSAVAEAVIRLSQILHLDTVAEGIEDESQATELTLLGCRTGQGYHYARPMSAEALEELIHTSAALGAPS